MLSAETYNTEQVLNVFK